MKFIYLIILLIAVASTKAQDVVETSLPQSPAMLKEVNEKPAKGTYQIMLSNPDVIFEISDETWNEVNSARKADENTFIILNEYVKIKVLPYNVIKAKDFKPLEEYSYEN